MAESQERFVANPKGKAPIWEFFRFRCKDGQVDSTKAYCTECKASVKLGGGTSNMSAHVRRHLPLLLNKPFGKMKITSVRNLPGPAPIDSTGAGPSASTDSDVDPLTSLKTSDAAPKHTHKKKKQKTNDTWRSTQWISFFPQEDVLVSMLGSRIREIRSLVSFLFDFSFVCVCGGFFFVCLFVCLFFCPPPPPPPPHPPILNLPGYGTCFV